MRLFSMYAVWAAALAGFLAGAFLSNPPPTFYWVLPVFVAVGCLAYLATSWKMAGGE